MPGPGGLSIGGIIGSIPTHQSFTQHLSTITYTEKNDNSRRFALCMP